MGGTNNAFLSACNTPYMYVRRKKGKMCGKRYSFVGSTKIKSSAADKVLLWRLSRLCSKTCGVDKIIKKTRKKSTQKILFLLICHFFHFLAWYVRGGSHSEKKL